MSNFPTDVFFFSAIAPYIKLNIDKHVVLYIFFKFCSGPFTVFGPTDDAFGKLPPKVVKMLKEDKKLLADVLKFHVLSGKVYSSQLSNELTAPSLNPLAKVRINIYQGGKVMRGLFYISHLYSV